MRLAPGPLGFLVAVIGLWVGGRAAVLLKAHAAEGAQESDRPASLTADVADAAQAPAPRAEEEVLTDRPWAGRNGQRQSSRRAKPFVEPPSATVQNLTPWLLPVPDLSPRSQRPRGAPLAGPISTAAPDRWSGTAYLFLRDDRGGAALASGGQLGGSQMFARLAYRVAGPLAVAGRVYSPIESAAGAEAALGADLRLGGGGRSGRLSLERRIALGPQARDAWSAYAAGGFVAAVPLGLEADGYGQAGIVGARRRDLFVDGALRLTRPIALGKERRLGAGVGAWGAAQPGVSRLDLGPRASLTLPIAGRPITTNLDLRLRVVGRARPGSGLALTIGSDF